MTEGRNDPDGSTVAVMAQAGADTPPLGEKRRKQPQARRAGAPLPRLWPGFSFQASEFSPSSQPHALGAQKGSAEAF